MVETKRATSLQFQAVILAGGKGVRMGDAFKEEQKCMLNVDGLPILEHILRGLNGLYGKQMEVIIATGYRGVDIKRYFGRRFGNLRLTYAYDPRPLETRRRLLLTKELVVKPFFLLAGDILTPDSVLEKLALRLEEETAKLDKGEVVGIMTGAKNHSPAPTHGILTVSDGYLEKILFPPTLPPGESDLREMQRAVYSLDFFGLAQKSKGKFISDVVKEVLRDPRKRFAVETHDGPWAHYMDPIDFQRFQNLSFLNKNNYGARAHS